MGFVTLGLFAIFDIHAVTGNWRDAAQGMEGAMVQMISHGFISGAMFLCVGVLYDRMHSRQIGDYGGVVNTMPRFAALWMLFSMANAGLPATSGFVGEFLVIVSSFKANVWYAVLASTTLILGAAYTLWMFKRVVFGEVRNAHVAELTDINARETSILAVLAIAVLALGIWPAPLLNTMHTSVDHLLEQIAQSKTSVASHE
jgi:NADH-quinone oxidoreductase subunit M